MPKSICSLSYWRIVPLAVVLFISSGNAFAGCMQQSNGSINIVRNGKSPYSIVIPAEPSPEELRAAEFLNYHIHKISGCELEIISSGSLPSENSIAITKKTDIISGDGYSVRTEGKTLFIDGGSKKGCIYGVAELLEKYMNVRYYTPRYVVIPQNESITLPSIRIEGSSPNTYRNVNGDFVKDKNYRDFHRLHTIGDMFAEGYYVHTFHRLIPWPEYFESNPEFFAYMNGKRIIDQLCLSNEKVLTLVIEKLRNDMVLQPGKQVWSVSQDDNFSYCQCESCRRIIEEEGSPAGPIIRFVNRVAEAFPDKIISTLAYQYSRKAPLKTAPRENVQVMLCTIELNRSLSIADDPASASFLRDMEDWGKISNHIYLWDYTVNFNHHISPFPNLHTLQPNIKLFAANNVKEHFQQSNTGTGHEFSELKSYLLAKLLWNPEADALKIIREFTDGYYGPAGKWIRKYIESLEQEILETRERLDIYGPPINHQHTFLSAENMERYNFFFDEAEKVTANEPDYLLHVRKARMPLQYAIMEIGKNDMFGPRGWYREVDGEFVSRKDMVAMLEDFYATSQAIQSAPVNEAGLTAEEYYHSSKRFINVQVKDNLAFRKKVVAQPAPSETYSKGDLTFLTNGVRGANDYKVHWLGWEAKDFSLLLDLEAPASASTIELSTLWDQKSWILHPRAVSCFVSENGVDFLPAGELQVTGDQKKEEVTRQFEFKVPGTGFRYVKFDVKGTLKLPAWHPSAGGGSWVFVDEIVVK